MRHRGEPERARECERRLVRLGRELGLEPAEADAHDAAVAETSSPLDGQARLLLGEAARDVRSQSNLDAVALARRVRAVADPSVDLVPGAAAPDAALGRAEDPLEVDAAACALGLLRIVDDDLSEVGGGPQRVRGQHPDLDEVREVAEAVERFEVVGQRIVVPLRDRSQRLRAAPRHRLAVPSRWTWSSGILGSGTGIREEA